MRHAAAALVAAGTALVCAASAQAGCADVFSKVRQRDQLAPLVVGDSVTVAAGDYLGERGFAVDAVACRTFAQGLEVMASRRLPDLVVVALGSNAAVSGPELGRALELVGPVARLVLVLPNKLGGGPDPDGRIMRAFEGAHPDQVGVLDWPAYSAGHASWFAPDGLHLTTDGARAFTQLIGEAVDFAPVDSAPKAVEPPPARPRRAHPPRGDPAVVELWRAVGRAIARVAAPGLRLLGRLVADSSELGRQDL